MTRPSRAARGVPRAGARVTCERAALRRALAVADAGREIDGAQVRHAARGSIAAAMVDAAERCSCEACPAFLADARRNLTFGGVLRRDARKADRIGRDATEWSDRTLTERALLKAAGERSGARGVKRWHAKRRADSAADAAFDNLTNRTESEN